MPKWEYRKIDLTESVRRGRGQLVDDMVLLNEAGQEGWELVGITPAGKAYLL